jgi:hypothetical protein
MDLGRLFIIIFFMVNFFLNAYEDLIYLKIRPISSIKVVDTTFVKNVFGRGSNPFDRGRKATKVSAIVDHKGVPLTYTKPNKNYSRTLFHTLSKCKFLSKSLIHRIAGMSLNTFLCRIVYQKKDRSLPNMIIGSGS